MKTIKCKTCGVEVELKEHASNTRYCKACRLARMREIRARWQNDPAGKMCECGNPVEIRTNGEWQCLRCYHMDRDRLKREKVKPIEPEFDLSDRNWVAFAKEWQREENRRNGILSMKRMMDMEVKRQQARMAATASGSVAYEGSREHLF